MPVVSSGFNLLQHDSHILRAHKVIHKRGETNGAAEESSADSAAGSGMRHARRTCRGTRAHASGRFCPSCPW
eukprot:320303-Prymnesium_polylepis.1